MTRDSYEHIQIQEQGDIFRLAFDRPDSLNALNTELVREFRSCLENLHKSPPKGVLVTGNGNATCAGLDLEIVEKNPESQVVQTFERIYEEGLELLRTFPRPTALAAKKAVVGAGFIYYLECDLAVVGDDTTLMLPEVQYGLNPVNAVKPLKNQVGERIGKEIALTGKQIAPNRTFELGMSNDVVQESDVENATRELLEEVTQHEEAYNQGVIEDVIKMF